MNPNPVDLHCHSRHSDGVLSVSELIKHAAAQQIQMLALTDHDTLAGIDEAQTLARGHEMLLIRGVEMSATWGSHTVHVLGLDIDLHTPELRRILADIQDLRGKRAEDIASKLERCGIADAMQHTVVEAGHSEITRTHFARMLVHQGHCKDLTQAFKRYLGQQGKRAYVKTQWPAMQTVIAAIHAANGQAVLAHPMSYKISSRQRRALVEEFAELGGNGIEVSAGGAQNPQNIKLAADLAREFGLCASQGSDLHDPIQRWLRFGRLMPIPEDLAPIWTQFRYQRAAA